MASALTPRRLQVVEVELNAVIDGVKSYKTLIHLAPIMEDGLVDASNTVRVDDRFLPHGLHVGANIRKGLILEVSAKEEPVE